MAMWDFSISRSLHAMARTLPFILLRLAVYFGITLAYVIVTGTGAGVGYGIGFIGDNDFQQATTFWGGLTGFVLVSAVLYWLREYILYMVKAAHIAALVEVLDGQPVQPGRGQVDRAAAEVKARFVEANVLFALDQLIKGVLRSLAGLINVIASMLPGLTGVAALVNAVLRIAAGYVDEVILAHNIRTKSDNPWAGARRALVLYGQNAAIMVKNALWLTVFIYGVAFMVFVVMLTPAAGLAYAMPGGWSGWGFVVAVLLAWSVKQAVIEPFAIFCLMQVYFKTIEGQVPDPEWEARLEEASAKFRELGEKAKRWAFTKGGAQPA
jgi:hypothetical protein